MEEKLTVSGSLVLVFGGVGTVSSRCAGAHAEDVPGGWFQTGDDHARSLGSSWGVAQLLVFLRRRSKRPGVIHEGRDAEV